MSHLAPLIADLALILISAGIMTLIFKKLGQPLVLGYVVAGFLASPHLSFTPSVTDSVNVQTWADIGVIFLLFALGLEFSFKKIMKVGGPAVIAACTIIVCMLLVGTGVGTAFGWKQMDCIFLGGMIAMSSTTIIYKAFNDLGIMRKQFTSLVLSVLILEDILAIVLMVMLSTMAVSNNFEGREMIASIGKLVFFLVLWFVVGIFLIPQLLKRCRRLMSDETLLVVSLGLCFGMVVVAAHTGFSAAFGAFIMGSILAETVEAESIEHLVKPVKDLFGAIFFVSVGMMVDPAMIVAYAGPILAITAAVLVGQAVFGTLGVMLSGQPLRVAMQCGFSLTQIGEFAFIIASLGVSLGVTSDFLYPIVVAVSVVTTFLTPYMIRAAEPAANFVDRHLPASWRTFLDRYATGAHTVNHESLWRRLVAGVLRTTLIYVIISIAIAALGLQLLAPFCEAHLPGIWGSLVAAVVTTLCLAPFLRAIMIRGNSSVEFTTLWQDSRSNRPPLVALVLARVVIAVGMVTYVIGHLLHFSVGLVIGLAILAVCCMAFSRKLKRQSLLIEQKFLENLRSRERRAEYLGEKKPEYAGRLLSRDMHLADFDLPGESQWVGHTLAELNLGKRFGIHVVSILRGRKRINIPGGSVRLYPADRIQVIATDEEITTFGEELKKAAALETDVIDRSETILRQLIIDPGSPFLGKTLRNAGIREHYHCLIAGVERGDAALRVPNPNIPFAEGDVLWIVGEKADVYRLVNEKEAKPLAGQK